MAVWQHNSVGKKVKAPAVVGGLAGYAWEKDRTQHILYRGKDQQIHELWQRIGGNWEHNAALNQQVGAPLIGGDPYCYAWESDGTQHVIFRALNNQLQELWQRQGQGWQKGGALTEKTHAPLAAGDPFGYAWEKDETQHIVYRAQDGHIHELWQKRGQDWQHGGSISLKVGAPAAAGDPVGYAWEKDETQHIFYRAQDGHIYELWQKRGDSWKSGGSVTKSENAPAAAGDPVAYVWESDGTQHVVYRGTDNQIHEIWFRGGNWSHNSLSNAAKAPAAASDPISFAWEKDGSQHIAYITADGQVHELWQRQGQGWQHGGALSEMTKGPKASGGVLSGYSFDVDESQHVVYVGEDGLVHELWQKKGIDVVVADNPPADQHTPAPTPAPHTPAPAPHTPAPTPAPAPKQAPAPTPHKLPTGTAPKGTPSSTEKKEEDPEDLPGGGVIVTKKGKGKGKIGQPDDK